MTSTASARRFLAAARLAARGADDKKARDIRPWDVRRLSGAADFYVVATCDSNPQIQAAEDAIEESLKEKGLRPLRREGRGSAPWRVLDFGGLVVHLLTESARLFYGLERLWEGAKSMPWAERAARASARPSRSRRAPNPTR
ncbi:MAG TPA: ribosome silencing factor [Elusimicrobiota bacterium]|nr:ribosome silencing factor [Elusimicrobiota bacterium]